MWTTVQVYYYADERHSLLADAIQPTMDELQRQGALNRFWYSSHWKRGPHVDIHIETSAHRFEEEVKPLLISRLTQYLKEHPSSAFINEEEVVTLHTELAWLEQEDGPLTPFIPDNSIRVVPYTMRPQFWGGPEAAELAASFFSETTPLLLNLADEVRDDYCRRLDWSMGLMIATVAACGEMKGTHLCFRSHSQGFLAGSDPGGEIRAAMNQWYVENESWISQTLAKWCSMVNTGSGADDRFDQYRAVAAKYRGQFEAEFAAGRIIPIGTDEEPASIAGANISNYHRFMYSYPDSESFWFSPWFQSFRYTINLTYNWLASFGTVALEKYFLCYTISNYMEVFYGKRWWEIVVELQGLPPGTEAVTISDEH